MSSLRHRRLHSGRRLAVSVVHIIMTAATAFWLMTGQRVRGFVPEPDDDNNNDLYVRRRRHVPPDVAAQNPSFSFAASHIAAKNNMMGQQQTHQQHDPYRPPPPSSSSSFCRPIQHFLTPASREPAHPSPRQMMTMTRTLPQASFRPQQDGRLRGLQQDVAATSGCLSPIGEILRGPQDRDRFGSHVSISQNGKIVAVGAWGYFVAGRDTGLVQVYKNVNKNGHWEQRGTNIEGEKAEDGLSTNALSNDGNILAVGAHTNDDSGNLSGHVRVYQFNVTMGDWQQLGVTLVGLAAWDFFGWRVALSGDGTSLAVGAYGGGPSGGRPAPNGVEPNGEGQVRVFFWNGSTWVNQGHPINGQNSGDRFGSSIALSEDGSILAAGAHYKDANGKGNSGSVQVFEFANNNSWNPLGQELYGDNASDWFGVSVSLSSNGRTIAVGARNADSNGLSNSGQVYVYHFNENNRKWTPHGSSLTGNLEDYFGASVSLSGNGLILAVGAPESTSDRGFLRVFQWDGGEDWQPFGNDLVGTSADDDLGEAVAVARDGSTVVVGGDSSGTGHPGLAMVVQLKASCQTAGPIMSPTVSPMTKGPTISPTVSITVKKISTMAVLLGVIVGILALFAVCVAVWAIRGYRKRHQQTLLGQQDIFGSDNSEDNLPPHRIAEDPPAGEPRTVTAYAVNIQNGGVHVEELSSSIPLVDVPALPTPAPDPGGLLDEAGIPEAQVDSFSNNGPKFKDQARSATPPKAHSIPPDQQGQKQSASAPRDQES